MKSSRIGPPGLKRISLVLPAKFKSERAARFQAATASIVPNFHTTLVWDVPNQRRSDVRCVAHVPTGTPASLSLSRFEIGAATTRAMSRSQH